MIDSSEDIRFMNFGLSEKTYATIQGILKTCPRVEKAIRAKGNFKNGSDIDLTLVGAQLNDRDLLTISGYLDDSFIPHQVDLSIFAHLDNAKLREHIERVGVVFYERTI